MKLLANVTSFAFELAAVLVLAAWGSGLEGEAPAREARAGRAALVSTIATARDLGAQSLALAVEQEHARSRDHEAVEPRARISSI